MLWWQVLLPGSVIALLIRFLALFGPNYFTWIELLSVGDGESRASRIARRKVMAQRTSIPLLVMAGWSLMFSETSWFEGALIGAVGGALIVWPIVFHGLPWGIFTFDWLLLPVYFSFLLTLSMAGALGVIAVLPFQEQRGLTYLVSNLAMGLLLAAFFAVGWWIYDVSTAALGRLVNDRSYR